jgi:hypothetical protein
MEIEKGDVVELIDDKGMAAQHGAKARVMSFRKPNIHEKMGMLGVQWIDDDNNGQHDGEYSVERFKKVEEKVKHKPMGKDVKYLFEDGKLRVVKMLKNHINDYTKSMVNDLQSLLNNGIEDDLVAEVETIIESIRIQERLMDESINKVQSATSIMDVLEAMENTIFEDMEEVVLSELFGLMIIRDVE